MTLHKVDNDPRVDDAVVDSAALFGRRRWSRRLRAWRPVLVGMVLVVAVVFLSWVVFFSAWLGMRNLEVSGLHRVTPPTVAAAADMPPGHRWPESTSMPYAPGSRRSLRVASATVRPRAWPHSLAITVTERQPVAAVHRRRRLVADGQDRCAVRVDADPGPAGRSVADVEAGAGPETLSPGGIGARGCSRRTCYVKTKRVTAGYRGLHHAASSPDGCQVRWGSAADSAEKAAVLRALLHHKAAFYDVSVPTQPATKR